MPPNTNFLFWSFCSMLPLKIQSFHYFWPSLPTMASSDNTVQFYEVRSCAKVQNTWTRSPKKEIHVLTHDSHYFQIDCKLHEMSLPKSALPVEIQQQCAHIRILLGMCVANVSHSWSTCAIPNSEHAISHSWPFPIFFIYINTTLFYSVNKQGMHVE